MSDHHFFMSLAYQEALKAQKNNEVPVGAVIVKDNEVIGRAYNQREQDQKVASHAEMLAIQKANIHLKSWRLEGCQMYVTLEPCPMCAGAIVSSRIHQLIYACLDPKLGACHSEFGLMNHPRWNHKVEVLSGVMSMECTKILEDFFKNLRQ